MQLTKQVQLKKLHEYFPLEKTYYREKNNLTQENKLQRYFYLF